MRPLAGAPKGNVAKRYSDAERVEIVRAARRLLAEGATQTEAARHLKVPLTTLHPWLMRASGLDDDAAEAALARKHTPRAAQRYGDYDDATIEAALQLVAEGIPQREVEARTGVPRSTISTWVKTAEVRPGERVDLRHLYAPPPPPPEPLLHVQLDLTRAELQALLSLSDKIRAAVTAAPLPPSPARANAKARGAAMQLAPEVEDPGAEIARIRARAWDRALVLDARRRY